MVLQLEITGLLLIALSCLHVIFPKRFKWKDELPVLSLINRQIFYVHTFFIALMLLLLGALCISSAEEIINTPLGHRLAFGLFVFWSVRLVVQFFVYSNKLWKGKKLETTIHVIFSLLWAYFSVIFFIIWTY